MYATLFSETFFNALTGKNAELIERSLIALYDTNYGNNTLYFDDMSREDVKKTIISSIGELDWHDEDTDNKIKKDQEKANQIVAKLKTCGWIDFPTNRLKATRFFAFTKYGKKFAQLLYSLQDNDIDLSKQRNVRQTKFSLEKYKEEKDPQHLIDAFNTSKDVISDLTDAINDIKELKNILMIMARDSIDDAGENFLEFLSNKFRNDIANRFGEDSVERYQYDIKNIIDSILLETEYELELRVSNLNRGTFIAFYTKHESLERILDSINERILNACETKLPSLKSEVQSYISCGGRILKQTNALMFNQNKNLYKLAKRIKESEDITKKIILNDFSNTTIFPKLKIFSTNGIRIRNKAKRKNKDCYIGEKEEMSLEILINSIYNKKQIEAFSYTKEDQKKYIDLTFSDMKTIQSSELPINSAKDILLSLFSVDYVADNPDMFDVEPTGIMDDRLYYKAEGFKVTRKK